MNKLNRRHFIQNILTGTFTLPLLGQSSCSWLPQNEEEVLWVNPIVKYKVVSETGKVMSGGHEVPARPDGMTCIWSEKGNYLLIRNQEIEASTDTASPIPEKSYDPLAPGSVTILELDKNLKVVNERFAVVGTSRNCSGGKTPWNTWLTCEETHQTPETNSNVSKRHGYVFEVDPKKKLLENAVPIREMGRFLHEACAVHEASGYVYMTEDQGDGCFYRYRPKTPGKLHDGGTLEALKLDGKRVSWIPLLNPDPDKDNLRITARGMGAAVFVRGEGMAVLNDDIYFSCSSGGKKGLGQIFVYNHAENTLELLYESTSEDFLQNPDNLTFNQYGDLIIGEDTDPTSRLLGMTADKKFYEIAASNSSEWAGVCFSPDNKYLFANLLQTGETVAFEVPWEKLR